MAGFPQEAGSATDVSKPDIWALTEKYAAQIAKYEPAQEKAELIGTVFTARDMLRVVDALDEDGLLRFWGQLVSFVLKELIVRV